MKWANNILSIAEHKVAGTCPICKSNDTNFRFVRVDGVDGFGDIWCNTCKNGFHISRCKVTDDILKDIELPRGIKF